MYFKVAPGSYLVQAFLVSWCSLSLRFFHMFLVLFCLCLRSLPSEAKTQYQPSPQITLFSSAVISPPPIPLVYREVSHMGLKITRPLGLASAILTWSYKDYWIVASSSSSEAMCSEQPSRKQMVWWQQLCVLMKSLSLTLFSLFFPIENMG